MSILGLSVPNPKRHAVVCHRKLNLPVPCRNQTMMVLFKATSARNQRRIVVPTTFSLQYPYSWTSSQRGNFTDVANFALRCLVCQKGLKGQSDAVNHAKARLFVFLGSASMVGLVKLAQGDRPRQLCRILRAKDGF